MAGYLTLTLSAATIVTGLAIVAPPSLAEEPTGTFVLVSDIHFDPFDPDGLARTLAVTDAEDWMARFAALPPAPASQYGKDTNHVLLSSALAALAKTAANADFAIFTGDLLSHEFEDDTAKALGVPLGSAAQRAFSQRTTIFVAEALRDAFAGKPVIVALGNNDSDCGDYEIEPGGDYLAATRETARTLVGAGLVAHDFDATYAAGGYYAARHPTVANTLILVVNDILWSKRYQDACGADGLAAGRAQMDWLTNDARGAESGRRQGVDGAPHPLGHRPLFDRALQGRHLPGEGRSLHEGTPSPQSSWRCSGNTPTSSTRACPATSISMTIGCSSTTVANPLEIDKVAPAISPIFGQNPGLPHVHLRREDGSAQGLSPPSISPIFPLSPPRSPPTGERNTSSRKLMPRPATRSRRSSPSGMGSTSRVRIRDAYFAYDDVGHGALDMPNSAPMPAPSRTSTRNPIPPAIAASDDRHAGETIACQIGAVALTMEG